MTDYLPQFLRINLYVRAVARIKKSGKDCCRVRLVIEASYSHKAVLPLSITYKLFMNMDDTPPIEHWKYRPPEKGDERKLWLERGSKYEKKIVLYLKEDFMTARFKIVTEDGRVESNEVEVNGWGQEDRW